MAALAGKDGAVKVGSDSVALMDSWELNPQADMLDITSFGDDWKQKLAGLKDWTAKGSAKFDMTDTNGQLALWNAMLNGTTVGMKFYVDDTHFISGTAFVKAISPKVGVADAEKADFDFEGSGALSYS